MRANRASLTAVPPFSAKLSICLFNTYKSFILFPPVGHCLAVMICAILVLMRAKVILLKHREPSETMVFLIGFMRAKG
jgi:p-aminobenzoyl-glutamate transporter AbgT